MPKEKDALKRVRSRWAHTLLKATLRAANLEHYDMLRFLREFLQWREGDAIILAEANVLPKTDMEYFGDAGDRMQ